MHGAALCDIPIPLKIFSGKQYFLLAGLMKRQTAGHGRLSSGGRVMIERILTHLY
jgi:hypothetical protein